MISDYVMKNINQHFENKIGLSPSTDLDKTYNHGANEPIIQSKRNFTREAIR
jgi:hypothetical protein